ncbi:phage head closure protein [Glaciimonas sp. PCH181]|uniref:phage head closure protein n=1 Tax=Glaciimonas sp. PCH181 TaxID=2133943 RepID=UPI000D3818B5|nr:phage head closure protein [Glaciimonas sp. PCH181]PUA17267.1 head-tail adaptor protein [Glaciimonas sp. PCH181]
MRAGDLLHRITLQQRSTAADSLGQQATTWSDLFTIWAYIESLTARELLAAQAVQSEVNHRITVRYRAEFANPISVAAMRAIYKGRYFNISGALNLDERNRTIELLASEGLNNG